MWKAAAGQSVKVTSTTSADDDWDTDPDFVNDVSEKEQRKGAKTVEGSIKPKDNVDVSQLRNKIVSQNEETVKKEYSSKGTFAAGYGGKFGVQTDRMDKSAVGFDAMTEPKADHSSVPKYQKPTTVSAPASSIKSKFEQLGAGADAEKAQQDKINQERAARAEKEKAERERMKKEQDQRMATEKAERDAMAQAAAARRAQAEADAAAAASAQAEQQQYHEPEQQAYQEPEQQAYQEPVAEATYEQPQEEATYEQPQEENAYEQPQESQTYEEMPAAAAEGNFTATALYEYEATGDDELPFKEGEVIYNIEVIDEGWWRGECNGRFGMFPCNYVQANQ